MFNYYVTLPQASINTVLGVIVVSNPKTGVVIFLFKNVLLLILIVKGIIAFIANAPLFSAIVVTPVIDKLVLLFPPRRGIAKSATCS